MDNGVKAMVPELRFGEFGGQFNKWSKFNSVVESTLYGPRFNAKDYSLSGNVKTIRGTDVDRNGEFKYQQVPIAQIEQSTVEAHKLLDGDLVMITTAECGQTGVFRSQNIDYISSAYGVRIRLNNKAYPDYFKYFFQTRHARKEIASFVRKATVANLPGSDILKIKINLIPAKEQKKIANFLTSVDQRISLLKQKKAALEQYKKGLMQKIFSQEIRFKDDNGEDYLDWEEKRLGDVALKVGSGKTPRGGDKVYTNTGIPFIRSQNVIDNKLLLDEIHITQEIHKEMNISKVVSNDILLNITGGSIGRSCVVPVTFKEGNVNQHVAIIRLKKDNSEFIQFFLSSYFGQKLIYQYQTGSGREGLNFQSIKSFKIKFPVINEQQKIADCLSSMDQSINKLKKQIEQSTQFKKGLLQRMFV